MNQTELKYKEYFRSPQTVSTWWRNHKWSPTLKSYFAEQLKYVISFADWRDKTVLDAGTGFGRVAKALGSKGAKVVGIDINLDMIDLAQSETAHVNSEMSFLSCDIENLNFQNESFDAVVCIETLMHLPNPLKAISEFERIIKPNGLIFLGINNIFSLITFSNKLMQTQTAIYNWFKHRRSTATLNVCHLNTLSDLRYWVQKNKLIVYEEVGFGLFHPEMALAVAPNVAIPFPDFLANFFLSIENLCNLGNTWIKHLMKAIIVVAKKSLND